MGSRGIGLRVVAVVFVAVAMNHFAGWLPAVDSGAVEARIDWSGFLARHDMLWKRLPSYRSEEIDRYTAMTFMTFLSN